ncbi:MAG: cysteine--tRNA ligase [Candidatus Levybacteria bacterium RBG_16_35_11]|nr:MAG: cysteine--tRNA ligase [Candidatus Levybacteria bacterium RBG_16_35_11]
MLRIYNTLTRKIEKFQPINPPDVKMYTCGPTVYDYMHIGNLRTFVLSDTLQRVLEYNGFNVKAVENITDIDDKIINKAKDENNTIEEIADKFTKIFLEDVKKLNIKTEKLAATPKATEYIKKMVAYVADLVKKGFAYEEKGSIYFDISKFPNYGKLSQLEKRELKTGSKVLADNYEKDNVRDFALWKSVGEDEVGFDSPWGKGRPGWHIECAVMSQEFLGNKFDIHLGGVDLIFPHHENEIAQAEVKTGESPFVKYWVHGAHMLVDGKKMSKSLNNFYTIEDIEKRKFDPLALRYLYLQTHFRQEMNFTFGALDGAQKTLNRLKEELSLMGESKYEYLETERDFYDAINDDLNMPKALAVVWDLVNSKDDPALKAGALLKFDKVLGLRLDKVIPGEKKKEREVIIPKEVFELVKKREGLRKEKRYHLADQIRHKIRKFGFDVEDRDGETKLKPIS